jgi:hypothetical protein
MLFEQLLILSALGIGVFFILIPLVKLIKSITPKKRNPLAEAKERLEQARVEVQAARLNKETEQVYDELYKDVLEDEPSKKENSR